MSICDKDPLYNPCRIRVPMKVYGGSPPLIAHGCAYYTCPEGLTAARAARERGDGEIITVDGEEMIAYRFGSMTKPTDDPEALIHRYVIDDGRIMATSPDGSSVVFTGQTTESLAVVWRMLP